MPIRIEVHLNFLARQGTWASSGAFVDSGWVDFDGSVPRFSRGAFKLEQVVSPIVASDGSSLLWTFAKTFTATSETTWESKAEWHFISGTGRYEGITGHGELVGTLELPSYDLVDVFTGWVRLP